MARKAIAWIDSYPDEAVPTLLGVAQVISRMRYNDVLVLATGLDLLRCRNKLTSERRLRAFDIAAWADAEVLEADDGA